MSPVNQAKKLLEKAYELQYTKKDFVSAFKIYQEIVSSFPNSFEAKSSAALINKIEKSGKLKAQVERQKNERLVVERAKRARDEGRRKEREEREDREKLEKLGDAFLYEKFTEELERDDLDSAVWNKALTIHYGDEKKAKYEYVKLRVEDAKARLGLSTKEIPQRKAKPEPEALTLEDKVENSGYKLGRSLGSQVASEHSSRPSSTESKKSNFLFTMALVVLLSGPGVIVGGFLFSAIKNYPYNLSEVLSGQFWLMFALWPFALIYVLLKSR
jgi:hypothetical protein